MCSLVAIALVPGCAMFGFERGPEQWQPLASDDPRPALYLEALARDAAARPALRGRARLVLDAPDLSFRRPQRIALERPDKLRVEVIGLFGQIAAVVASDGQRVTVFDAASGQIQEGQLEQDLLWRVARIALAPREAASLLVGVAPGVVDVPVSAFPAAEISADGRIRVLRSGSPDSGGASQLEFDALGRLIGASRAGRAGSQWSARFGDFRVPNFEGESEAAEAPARFPFAIDLAFPERDATARVEYDAVELAESLPDDLFVLQLAR